MWYQQSSEIKISCYTKSQAYVTPLIYNKNTWCTLYNEGIWWKIRSQKCWSRSAATDDSQFKVHSSSDNQGSISPTFYEQLLRKQIPKAQKDGHVKHLFALLGSAYIKAAYKHVDEIDLKTMVTKSEKVQKQPKTMITVQKKIYN